MHVENNFKSFPFPATVLHFCTSQTGPVWKNVTPSVAGFQGGTHAAHKTL